MTITGYRLKGARACAAATIVAIAIVGCLAASAYAFPVFAGGEPSGGAAFAIKPVTLETKGGTKIKCSSYQTGYSIRGNTEVALSVHGYTCTSHNAPCFSYGDYYQPAGQIEMEFLGSLVYLNQAKHQAGLLFRPFYGRNRQSYTIQIACLGQRGYEISGEVIAAVGPTNKIIVPPAGFPLKFKQVHGVQSPLAFEGFPGPVSLALEPPEKEPIGISLSTTLQFPVPMELAG